MSVLFGGLAVGGVVLFVALMVTLAWLATAWLVAMVRVALDRDVGPLAKVIWLLLCVFVTPLFPLLYLCLVDPSRQVRRIAQILTLAGVLLWTIPLLLGLIALPRWHWEQRFYQSPEVVEEVPGEDGAADTEETPSDTEVVPEEAGEDSPTAL